MDESNSVETRGPVFAFKSSLVGAPYEFHLADDALEWRRGAVSGRTPYGNIRRIRLGFRPVTMQNYRFLTEIWPGSGPKLQIASTSWKSLVEHQRLDADYRSFVGDLCRRVGAAGGKTDFVTGSPAFLFWPGVVVLVGAGVALIGLIIRAITEQQWGGAGFIAAFLAFFLWQAGNFFHRNRPGRFDPTAVPPQVLPRA